MPVWTRIQGLNQREAFTRPLGVLEAGFYWDSVCAGISDSKAFEYVPSATDADFIWLAVLLQLNLETSASESTSLDTFSSKNVTRAWLATKNLHPLLAATIQERPDASGLDFVVDATRLGMVNSDEIVFATVQSDEEACSMVDNIINGPRRLSKDQLSQLWVLSFPRHTFDSSSPSTCYQCFLHLAHSISDAAAQNTIMRTFLDILVHSPTLEKYIPKDSLESRLILHLAVDDLSPSRKYSLARQRWRLAIARVMYGRMTVGWTGGHTLPHTITPLTVNATPISRTLRHSFSKELGKRVIKSCRDAGITFGHALPVLAQVAHARVLHRLHIQGAISEAEWRRGITQPMHFAGPMSLRPYLDRDWLAAGGANRVFTAISFYRNTLPAMAFARKISEGSNDPETPPFEAFLSRPRFFHRCRIIKKQTTGFLGHPLQMEFTRIILRAEKLERSRMTALDWRAQMGETRTLAMRSSVDTGVQETPVNEYVLSNECSTAGDMTQAIPASYPLDDIPPVGRVHLTSTRVYLRCRPAELYISSVSYQQELRLVVFCDTRAYRETLVREWLTSIGQAMECYLGSDMMARL